MELFVSPNGNDAWSGRMADPQAGGADGPLATIGRACDLACTLKRSGGLDGPLTVWLRGGRYPLAGPLTFAPDDSGPITYAAYRDEKPILDAGERISGWRAEMTAGGPRWVVHLPDAAAGRWYFRQLFVNGVRRPRARLPKRGFYWMESVPGINFSAALFDGSDSFCCAAGDIQAWRNLTDVEVVAYHYWIEERMPIASFDPATRTVRSSRYSMFALKDDVAERYARYIVENVYEALSEPGEWYLDRTTGDLSYIPLPGETPETVEVYAPRSEQLLRLVGDPNDEKYVEYLRFSGITFQHSEWRQPAGGGEDFERAGIDYAASPQAAYNIPGAIFLQGARDCAIEDCTIEHIGGYAVELAAGCSGNRIIGNEMADLGAGGVKMNGSDAAGPVQRRTGNNRVSDNHIHAGGRVFPSAVGILSIHSAGNIIVHNHIHDLYYTGISCGWVWGYADNVSMLNHIAHNHIHDLGHGLLSDMGGIYTLGMQPGTVLRGNVIHDIEKRNYGGWAIYLDEGSSHILVESNICYNTSSQCFHQHYGAENIIRNNVFAFGREGQASLSRAEQHNSFTFERNIVISRSQPAYAAGYAGQLEKKGFLSDLNVLWDVSGAPVNGINGRHDAQANWEAVRSFSLAELQALGYDRYSVIADPQCRDLEHFDFTLADDSPAYALGWQAIDLRYVGPRPKAERL